MSDLPIARKTALTFIIATVVIDMLGIGLAWPILPQLVKELSGGPIGESAAIYGLLLSGYALVQFFVGPLVGLLSDRFGRRPVLLIALGGLGVDYLILALAPDLWWVVIGRLVAGALGATVSTANAYVADITPPEKRAAAFGLIGAAFGVGFILGPLLGGVLGAIDLRYPFFLAASLSFANVVFGFFFLPESLAAEKRKAFECRKANPFSAFLYIRRYSSLAVLMTGLFLTGIAQQGLQGIWVLWTEVQFGWGVAEAGYSLAWVGLCMAFVQGVLVRIVVARFGERRVVFSGYIISTVAFLILPFLSAGWMVYPGILFHMVGWGCAGPALQGLMSRNVPDNEQGLLQGTLTSVNTIAMIAGPLIATQIFMASTGPDALIPLPGLFYGFGAALFVLTLIIFITNGIRYRRRSGATQTK